MSSRDRSFVRLVAFLVCGVLFGTVLSWQKFPFFYKSQYSHRLKCDRSSGGIRTLTRLSMDKSLNAHNSSPNPSNTSLDVAKFLEDANKKPNSAIKTVIWPSTQLDINLATKLVGAVFGIEGMNVFPSVFDPKYPWKPSTTLMKAVKSTIIQEKSRGDGNVFCFLFPLLFSNILCTFPFLVFRHCGIHQSSEIQAHFIYWSKGA